MQECSTKIAIPGRNICTMFKFSANWEGIVQILLLLASLLLNIRFQVVLESLCL